MPDLVRFLHLANQLKDVRRTGWVRCGVHDAESVADHAWGVSLLALLLAPPGLDRHRLLALAVAHDLAETITGDITPHDDIPIADKRAREQVAMEHLAGLLNKDELTALWREYADHTTAESRFIHELDALEMAGQAISYERAGRLGTRDADRFIASASGRIHSPQVREHLTSLIASRSNPNGER